MNHVAIPRSVKVTILEQEYELAYPNPGQLLAIESLKQILTANQYGLLIKSQSASANVLLDLVDAFANFTVMCPALKSKLTLPYFNTIDMVDAAKMRQSFLVYFNFLKEVETKINLMLQGETPEGTEEHAETNEAQA